MAESQIEFKDSIGANWETYNKLMPEVADLYDQYNGEIYKDGSVKAKEKRLMALVGALVSGCRACMLYQTEEALNLGATVDEILETCAVAISLGGTMAAGEVTHIMGLLKEIGEIE
ncbi:carboxymuconolactone decarboxylase family protein [Desulfovibrio sp. JC022]|uniref:carboxymuconolactone decarboxylase family protein n=1 Tax=Desulfovibrio sp. JC022 TaxID=2593642 RepID=UPI0013D576BC|nr:carboxymuconolactone decarboxylase family protein [Desulfovibrio sp. JC022]NDV24147.1 carboxymuconolactone decarboxylase family protein [Desulfovibrio sp. JC022]